MSGHDNNEVSGINNRKEIPRNWRKRGRKQINTDGYIRVTSSRCNNQYDCDTHNTRVDAFFRPVTGVFL
jgi:hypothetical protein